MATSKQATIGSLLKERRRQLRLSLKEVSDQTKIKVVYLEALEGDHFDAFPGQAYLTGFLRSYAAVVGLDADVLLGQLQQQTPSPVEAALEIRSPLAIEIADCRTFNKKIMLWGLIPLLMGGLVCLFLAYHLTNPLPSAVVILGADPSLEKSASIESSPISTAVPVSSESTLSAGNSSAAADVDPAENMKTDALRPIVVTLPAHGATLRVETTEPVRLEFAADRRPEQSYDLKAGAVVKWTIKDSAHLTIENLKTVRLWLDSKELDAKGRGLLEFKTVGAE